MAECKFDCPNIDNCPQLKGQCPAFPTDTTESALDWCNQVVSGRKQVTEQVVRREEVIGRNPLFHSFTDSRIVGRHTRKIFLDGDVDDLEPDDYLK
ncbi:hypothetical protein HYW46_02100 [Candidatus Daviesbacteria bacterium]|nr:hypothetical protein [Candidatus Daviesbacteria bacterium]